MLHFEGEKDFARPVAEVWTKLSDARFLVQCIPGVESVSNAEPAEAVCTLRPGFSFVRGTLEVRLRLTNLVSEATLRFSADSKGIGTTSRVEGSLNLEVIDAGTRARWAVDVKELGGLLKAVPRGLIQASAQRVITDIWDRVEARLAAG